MITIKRKLENLVIAMGTIAIITNPYKVSSYYHEKDYKEFIQKRLQEVINNETKRGIVDLDAFSLQFYSQLL
ncbi:MAG: hypothetical protein ABGW69_03560 [Nanoarchaeota archaeon]